MSAIREQSEIESQTQYTPIINTSRLDGLTLRPRNSSITPSTETKSRDVKTATTNTTFSIQAPIPLAFIDDDSEITFKVRQTQQQYIEPEHIRSNPKLTHTEQGHRLQTPVLFPAPARKPTYTTPGPSKSSIPANIDPFKTLVTPHKQTSTGKTKQIIEVVENIKTTVVTETVIIPPSKPTRQTSTITAVASTSAPSRTSQPENVQIVRTVTGVERAIPSRAVEIIVVQQPTGSKNIPTQPIFHPATEAIWQSIEGIEGSSKPVVPLEDTITRKARVTSDLVEAIIQEPPQTFGTDSRAGQDELRGEELIQIHRPKAGSKAQEVSVPAVQRHQRDITEYRESGSQTLPLATSQQETGLLLPQPLAYQSVHTVTRQQAGLVPSAVDLLPVPALQQSGQPTSTAQQNTTITQTTPSELRYQSALMAQLNTHIMTPDVFRGTREEDGAEWLRSLEHWMLFKQIVDPQKSAAVPVLLRDSALYWYDSLNETERSQFPQFKAAFLARYSTNKLTGWQESAEVWKTKQRPDQSVDSYINSMERKTARINATPEQRLYAVINGLLPNIRRQIPLKELTNLQDLRRWASIAESTAADEEGQGEITTILKEVQHFVRNLAATETTSDESTRGRSSSVGRRVTFSDEGDSMRSRSPASGYRNQPAEQQQFVSQQQEVQQQYSQTQNYQQPVQQQYQPPYQQQDAFQQQSYPRTYYARNQTYSARPTSNQPRYFNPNYNNFQPRSQGNSSNYTVKYPNFTPRQPNYNQQMPCSGCGGNFHIRPSQCPAWNVTCHTCGRLHHLSSVCRSGRRPQ